MIDDATAVTAGRRQPEDVRDLVNRVGHGQFDLVIMNPPFTRQGGQEADRVGIGNAAFAAFETNRKTQDEMQKQLRRISGPERLGSGNAGVAAHFVDLALRKLRQGGTLAMVLPLTSMSGLAWEVVRRAIRYQCRDVRVFTIADEHSGDWSFSADTGIAECLLIATKQTPASVDSPEGTFAVLKEPPTSLIVGSEVAGQVYDLTIQEKIGSLTAPSGASALIEFGDVHAGSVVHALLPESGPWPMVGVADTELAQAASRLTNGSLVSLGTPGSPATPVPICAVEMIAQIGPYHLDIRSDLVDGSPRGPFALIQPPKSEAPTYPMLWAHDAKVERRLVVEIDSEGEVKNKASSQNEIDAKAARIWASATRAHYNGDFRFNSQSLAVAMTNRKCIGGRAWPSVILQDSSREYAFSLWCNSTLGLLLHWWLSNKSQAGRGTVSVTAIPNIPTLDTRALSDVQHAEARRQFDLLRDERFLPFDQIDEDPARAKLDRAILVDVLGLPESLVEDGGPIDLIRRKLAREPQIHGGKKSRVVFTDDGEKSVPRDDRS